MIYLEVINYTCCYLNYDAYSKLHLHEVKSLVAVVATART